LDHLLVFLLPLKTFLGALGSGVNGLFPGIGEVAVTMELGVDGVVGENAKLLGVEFPPNDIV
jgi:hypothetical protein